MRWVSYRISSRSQQKILVHLAFSDCSFETQRWLSAQYFRDAIRNEDMQHAVHLSKPKDLSLFLVSTMKYEAVKSILRVSNYVRRAANDDALDDQEKRYLGLEKIVELLKLEANERKEYKCRKSYRTCWVQQRMDHVQKNYLRNFKKEYLNGRSIFKVFEHHARNLQGQPCET